MQSQVVTVDNRRLDQAYYPVLSYNYAAPIMPNTHNTGSMPLPSPSHKHNVNSSPKDSVLATPQLKKKRGRPPKPDSLTNRITTTLNININTSPLTSSPTAESNSNSIVKQGAPDFYTPLMRVSPSARCSTRRKRKNSTSSSLGASPALAKRSKTTGDIPTSLITPSSSSMVSEVEHSSPFPTINSKVMENISMITQNGVTYYNTPPPSNIKNEYPNYLASSGTSLNGSVIYGAQQGSISSSSSEVSSKQPTPPSSNLLPAVTLTGQAAKNEEPKHSPKKKDSEANDFSLKLTIDDSGKAVLSNDFFASFGKENSTVKKEQEGSRIPEKVEENVAVKTKPVRSNSVIEITSKQQPKLEEQSKQEQQEESEETQSHVTTTIPVAIPLRRYNSDLTGISTSTLLQNQSLSSIAENSIIPQTPKDTYFSSSNLGTGLTPIFNLTPQFNSLMYSMMNINSPKRGISATGNSINLIAPDFFTGQQQEQRSQLDGLEDEARLESSTVTMNELMGQGETKETIVNETLSTAQTSGWSSSEDSGDARLALKKVMHVKRQ